ncbi:hypothetical protein LINPERHAP1_LOCUS30335 [Linum perenne]
MYELPGARLDAVEKRLKHDTQFNVVQQG